MFEQFFNTILDLAQNSGFAYFFQGDGWKNAVMIVVSFGLMYLAVKKGFEPLLLLPIAFGMFLANIPNAGIYDAHIWTIPEVTAEMVENATEAEKPDLIFNSVAYVEL